MFERKCLGEAKVETVEASNMKHKNYSNVYIMMYTIRVDIHCSLDKDWSL